MDEMKCKDCKYITIFEHPTTKRPEYCACSVGIDWVRKVGYNTKSCRYFNPK